MLPDQYDMVPQAQPQLIPDKPEFTAEETQQSADTVNKILHPDKGGNENKEPTELEIKKQDSEIELAQWAQQSDIEDKAYGQKIKEIAQANKDARDDKQANHKMMLDERKAKLERNKGISDRTTARINQQGQVRTMQSADVKQAHDLQMKERDQNAKEQQQQQQIQMQAQQQQAQQQQAQQLAQQKAQQSQQLKSKPLGSGKYN